MVISSSHLSIYLSMTPRHTNGSCLLLRQTDRRVDMHAERFLPVPGPDVLGRV